MDPHPGFQGREGLHSEMRKDRSRTAKTWAGRGMFKQQRLSQSCSRELGLGTPTGGENPTKRGQQGP